MTFWIHILSTVLICASVNSNQHRMSKPNVNLIYGKIQYVDAFPDYKVEVVNAFADLKVQEVSQFPDGPGKWQIVDAFPDFKIQKVKAFGDFKIQYVNAFPRSEPPRRHVSD